MVAAAASPPITEITSTGPSRSPIAVIGRLALAWAMAQTIASVAARCRSDVPRRSMIASVATGAAKLTRLTCSAAKTPRPVRPKGCRAGASRATSQSRKPVSSSSRIAVSMTTMTGRKMNSTRFIPDFPAGRMISVMMFMVRLSCCPTDRPVGLRHPCPVQGPGGGAKLAECGNLVGFAPLSTTLRPAHKVPVSGSEPHHRLRVMPYSPPLYGCMSPSGWSAGWCDDADRRAGRPAKQAITKANTINPIDLLVLRL